MVYLLLTTSYKDVMNLFMRIYNKSWNIKRGVYLWLKRKRLKNHSFTILSNNCIGGVMSHDLHERFNSPTVNLWFKPADFFDFLENLDEYLSAEVVEVFEEGINYPIGRIYKGNDRFITLYFQHYEGFSDAIEKWKERAKRIQKSNLFVVFEYPAILDSKEEQQEMKTKFDALPYKNKIMITKQSDLSGDNIIHMRFYNKEYTSGKILKRKNKISVKRFLDDYDYVSFFNKGNIK